MEVLLAIEPDRVAEAWPLAEPHLKRAIDRTRKLDLETCFLDCSTREMQLWIVWDVQLEIALGAICSGIACYDTGWRSAQVRVCGGRDFGRWGAMAIETLEKWAIAEGCDALEIVGRKGWGRVFPKFKPIEYVYVKELGGRP